MTIDSVKNVRNEPPARKGVITAFLVGGAVILGVSIFAQSNRDKPAPSALPLTLITTDTTLSASDAVIKFVTPADLMLHPDGWMAGSMHPHLRVGEVVSMAGPQDIVHVAGDTFAWKLASPQPGQHDIELFWADMTHVPSGAGVTGRVVIKP